MKKILFLILLPLALFGQTDYQTIHPGSKAFYKSAETFQLYEYESHKYFRGVKVIDTIYENGYTGFKFFYEYHDDNYSQINFPWDVCVNMEAQCWLGPEVIIYDNGLNLYFNRNYDSIFIYTQANLNDSWLFYSSCSGIEYTAVITDISEKEFLGISDTVKTVSITGEGNTYTLEISKNYGFVKTINFRDFPGFEGDTYEVYEHDLAGLTDPAIGYQPLTIGDIYDYEIDDEIHKHENYGEHYGSIIKRVIDKEILNPNTVTYTYEKTYWWSDPYSSGYSFDTITETYDNLLEVITSNMPFEANGDIPHRYMLDEDDYNNRITKTLGEMRFWNFDTCYKIGYEWPYTKNEAIKGVGTNHYYSDNTYYMFEFIVYFKKGDETWGTPLNPPTSVKETENPLVISVFPNPAKDFVFIKLADNGKCKTANINIFALSGKQVYSGKLENGILTINVNNWPSGLFFYRISANGLVSKGKFMVND